MNESYFESIFAIFDEKPPFLSILDTFWAIFGQLSHSTRINDPLTIELNNLLNWISRFFFNWIIFWIESWVKQYWIEYWMNHFLAKFKHWIESDWVSATTTTISNQLSPQVGWASVMTMTVFHLVSLKQGGACSVFYQGIFPKDFDARMEALVVILKLASV